MEIAASVLCLGVLPLLLIREHVEVVEGGGGWRLQTERLERVEGGESRVVGGGGHEPLQDGGLLLLLVLLLGEGGESGRVGEGGRELQLRGLRLQLRLRGIAQRVLHTAVVGHD